MELTIFETIGFIIIGILFLILVRVFISAWTAINNHEKHGTYDKMPDPSHRCTSNCKRPLVKQDNGLYYCAWCDVEYRCKYVSRRGESCTLNNNCKYPNCELVKNQ
jgi:hypothetical protein